MSSLKNKSTTTTDAAAGAAAASSSTAAGATGSGSNKKSKGNSSAGNSTNSTGLLDYLQNCLSRKTLLSLYIEEGRGRFVCRAVLQELSLLAQQIVIRLHCTGGTFPVSGINLWIATSTNSSSSSSSNQQQGGSIYKELYKWAIIQEYNNTATDISLTIPFAKGLHASLSCLDSSPWVPLNKNQLQTLYQQHVANSNTASGDESVTSSNKSSKRTSATASTTPSTTATTLQLPTPDDLEKHTQYQWDAVLHFLVGTVGQKEPPPAVVHFLLQTNLMQPDPDYKPSTSSSGKSSSGADDAPLVITTKGYDFMLQDTYQQVWHFIVQYLYSIEQHPKGEDLLKEAILLLISLTFARTGCPYAASSLKKDCRTMIKDLSLFGLLYTTKIGKSTIFYPTRLAMQLVGNNTINSTSNTNAAGNALWSTSSKVLEASLIAPNPVASSHLAIIVQTNFQLAAYTTSELHVSMLGLFCDVSTIRRLPNIVMMQITRDSVKSAFGLGIRAEQILRFLEKHTHPKLRKNTFDSPVPSNVVDQIWLWDRELRRVIFTKVYQHQCVMGMDEFKAVQQYSIDKGIHAFTLERKQLLLLDYKYIDRIQAFVRQWRAQAISRQKE